jgi:hypothetical protein
VRAPADGYTLLLVGLASAINATLYEKLNFNFIRDVAPVAGIIGGPLDPGSQHQAGVRAVATVRYAIVLVTRLWRGQCPL